MKSPPTTTMIGLLMGTTTLLISLTLTPTTAFTFLPTPVIVRHHPTTVSPSSVVVLEAGGFEWEDPTEKFDQEVDNPFKKTAEEDADNASMKIDPARLLGPRLQGSNVYFIGMMGSGKSAVGDTFAKRTFCVFGFVHYTDL